MAIILELGDFLRMKVSPWMSSMVRNASCHSSKSAAAWHEGH